MQIKPMLKLRIPTGFPQHGLLSGVLMAEKKSLPGNRAF